MSTQSLIDRVARYSPGWSRPRLRQLIQEGQDDLLDCDIPYVHYISTDNQGFPSYLNTVAGTYRYDVNSTNLPTCAFTKTIGGVDYPIQAKRVLKAFVDATNIAEYGRRWLAAPYLFAWQNPYTTQSTRLWVADLPCRGLPALENTDPSVEFIEDPGTTTGEIFLEFTWGAPRLSAENIPLSVPVEFERALEDYVLGTVSSLSNGSMGDRLTKWEQYWKPRFRVQTSQGAQIKTTLATPRYC